MGALHSLAATVRQRWVAMAIMYAVGFWSIATIVSPFIQWKQSSLARILTALCIGVLIALLERRSPTPDSSQRDRRTAISLVIFAVLLVVAVVFVAFGVQ
jgi:hypothetical protein